MLTAENPSLPLIALHISPTGWVPTISVLTLAVCVQRRMLEQSSSMSSMSSMDWQTFWALYCDITLICQSNVWICDSGTRMRCIRFSSEIRCDRFGRLQQQNICLISPYMSTALPGGLGSCACFVLTAWFSLTLLTTWGHHRHEVGDNATPMSCWCLSRCAV
jgi:hypothetical protein